MNKDVIYIDVEDDITTIVGKIKNSKEKIIALVPPNRVGVLQSAVNMRLLKRAADQAKKRVVLISNSQSLVALAAAAKIPVARNLQSKPELAEPPVFKVDDDDVIDGKTLPIGELDRSARSEPDEDTVEQVIQASGASAVTAAGVTSAPAGKTVAKSAGGKKVKVPNFSIFRKKLFLIICGGLLLLLFLVWAIWFAPRATIEISAKTTTSTVDENVTLTTSGETVPEDGIVKALRQEQKSDVSVEFTPTGKKDVGERATGRVRIRANDSAILRTGLNVPSGTELLSSSGMKYETTESARFTRDDPSTFDGVTVRVRAAAPGDKYNGATGSASMDVDGVSSVRFVDATTGGTSREVTVVSQEDVVRAADLLNEKKADGLKDKLKEAFGSSAVVIEESYKEERSEPVPSVGVDSQASGPVTLAATTTASMYAIDKVDLSNFLKSRIEKEIEGNPTQKVYEDGSSEVKFAQFSGGGESAVVRVTANGTVGPTIDEDKVRDDSKGKTYGDIQSNLESINGVNEVDVRFWPFWVRTVPNNAERINIEFKLENVD